ADVAAAVKESLAGLAFPPRDLLNPVGLAVTEKPPFSLLAKFDPVEGIRGVPISVVVTAQRAPGFAEEIALSPQGLPANLALPALKIDKDKNEVKGQFTAAANAPVGKFGISFQGKSKVSFKEFTVQSPRVDLALS